MGEIVDLTPDDVARLEKQVREGESGRTTLTVLLAAFLVLGLFGLSTDAAEKRIVVAFSVGMLMLIFLPLLYLLSPRRLRADLRDRRKEILTGIIEEKVEVSSDPATYAFVVGGERHLVDVTTYTRHDKGQHIRIQRAIHSRVVLAVSHEQLPLR